MQRLITITLILLAASAFAASQKLSELPLISNIKDSARLYVYDTLSGNRNITGSDFRKQAAGGDSPLIKQALASYSSANANTPNSQYRRVFEVRDRSGKIVQYTTANGITTIGTPKALSINGVYPANASTGWFNNYSVRVCTFSKCSTLTGTKIQNKSMRPAPYVQYNKGLRDLTTSQQLIVGKSLAFDPTASGGAKYAFVPFSTAPGTTYTIRVLRQAIVQHDGEWASYCGASMVDVGGYCETTFTTR